MRYTKEGRGGVADEEVRVSLYLHSLCTWCKVAFLFLNYLDLPKGLCLFDGLGQWCYCWIASGKNDPLVIQVRTRPLICSSS